MRIVVSKEGWKVFEDFVGEAAEEMNEHNLLDGLSIWSTKEKEVYFGWNSIKFYHNLARKPPTLVVGMNGFFS